MNASRCRRAYAGRSRAIPVKAFLLMSLFLLSISIVGTGSGPIKPVYATASYTLNEWTVPTSGSLPLGLSLDPSGNCCWFVEYAGNNLAHMDPSTGTFQEWALPTAGSNPTGLTTATFNGQVEVWGTEFTTNKIFVFLPSTNTFYEFPVHAGSGPEYASVEPAGTSVRVWFTEILANNLGELVFDPSTPSSAILYEDPFPAGSGITLDALGQVWYTEGVSDASGSDNYVGVLRGDNTIKEWQIPTIGADPRVISISPLTQHPWIAEDSQNAGNAKVAELDPSSGGTVIPSTPTNAPTVSNSATAASTTATVAASSHVVTPASEPFNGSPNGQFTEWATGSGSQLHDVATDSSGNIWFLEAGTNKVGELTPTTADFSLSVTTPTISIPQGGSAGVTVLGNSELSFSGPVTLSVTGSVPSGVTFSTFNPNPISIPSGGNAPSALTVNVAAAAPTGTFPITISGTGSSGTHTTSFGLTITSGADFSASLASPTLSVGAGGSGTQTVTLTSIGSFNSPVTLSYGSLPAGVHVSFNPTPVTPPSGGTITSVATVSVDSGTPASSSPITITGTSGSLTHSQVFTLTITVTPDFTISGVPGTVSLVQGGTGMSTISVGSVNGFNSAVALSYSWIGTAPTGVSISLPGPVTPTGTPATSTLTISATASSSTGSFTVQVTGTSGALSHSANVGVLITMPATTSSTSSTSSAAGAPVCLIATATYGSQVAPEVQLLRNFRDNSIMKTQAGSSFMVVFNAWYYSFSPGVANYISSHSAERAVMKGVLYPLVGILYLTSNLYSATASFPELAVLLSGLIASSLIGAFYLGLPLSLIRSRVRRLRQLAAMERYLAFTLLSGITALVIGEALTSSTILMISSATVVLSTLLLAALATSSRVAKLLHH
ncbi:MAG: CFI-box-CTERM domain-containing protein [Candidatus Bathyarchaeia archaeon]